MYTAKVAPRRRLSVRGGMPGPPGRDHRPPFDSDGGNAQIIVGGVAGVRGGWTTPSRTNGKELSVDREGGELQGILVGRPTSRKKARGHSKSWEMVRRPRATRAQALWELRAARAVKHSCC